jgi:hypothetical protein
LRQRGNGDARIEQRKAARKHAGTQAAILIPNGVVHGDRTRAGRGRRIDALDAPSKAPWFEPAMASSTGVPGVTAGTSLAGTIACNSICARSTMVIKGESGATSHVNAAHLARNFRADVAWRVAITVPEIASRRTTGRIATRVMSLAANSSTTASFAVLAGDSLGATRSSATPPSIAAIRIGAAMAMRRRRIGRLAVQLTALSVVPTACCKSCVLVSV